jgi:hypothetical protein
MASQPTPGSSPPVSASLLHSSSPLSLADHSEVVAKWVLLTFARENRPGEILLSISTIGIRSGHCNRRRTQFVQMFQTSVRDRHEPTMSNFASKGHKAAVVGVFPHWQTRTRRSPGVEYFGVWT